MKDIENLINFFKEKFQKQESCAKKGHSGEEIRMISSYGFKITASYYCTECGGNYSGRATQNEINNFNKVVNKPFTL